MGMTLGPYLLVCPIALVASGLTLVSGFGLGTLLLPAFALFFPVDVAIALTAIVHLANNLFKLGLVGLRADRALVIRFGLPALLFAFLGAFLLQWLADVAPIAEYHLGARRCQIKLVSLVVAVLMILFAAMEALPAFKRVSIPSRWLPVGGALSGFVGGVSGHQGALRSAFLLRFKETLTPESFIATNVVIAVLVDVSRLTIYGATFSWGRVSDHSGLVMAATLSAFLGAWLGARLLKKITMRAVQVTVSVLLLLLAIALGAGLVG